jgi:hypothetical protein
MANQIVEYIKIDKDGAKLYQEIAGTSQEPKVVSLEKFFQEFSNYASVSIRRGKLLLTCPFTK